MYRLLRTFLDDRSGASAIEYAILAGVIALGIVAGATVIGTKTNNTFTNLGTSLR